MITKYRAEKAVTTLAIAVFVLACSGMAAFAMDAQPQTPNDTGIRVPVQAQSSVAESPVLPCVTVTCAGIGMDTPDWPSTHGTMPYRMFRDGVASTCAEPKSCPGTYGEGTFHYDVYQFLNTGTSEACVTAYFTTYCDFDFFAAAYQGTFDPENFCVGYLADIGSSLSQSFSFVVGPGECFSIVVMDTYGTSCPGGYSFSISGISCGHCGFDQTFQDNYDLAQACVGSKTGFFVWYASGGAIYSGTLNVYNGGTMFWSQPGAEQYVYLYYDPNNHMAWGYLYDYTTGRYSSLYDTNTLDNQPCGYLEQTPE